MDIFIVGRVKKKEGNGELLSMHYDKIFMCATDAGDAAVQIRSDEQEGVITDPFIMRLEEAKFDCGEEEIQKFIDRWED